MKWTLQIKDNEEYKPTLYCSSDFASQPMTEQHLYRVCLYDSRNACYKSPQMVLAGSPIDAVSQATCLHQEDYLRFGRTEELLAASIVEQVPFQIRGWGKNLF